MPTPAPGRTRADLIGHAARSMDSREPLTFVGHIGDNDVLKRGPTPGGVLIVVPGIWTSMPPILLSALRARRSCSTTGRCRICGEVAALSTVALGHADGCPVLDENLGPLFGAWARQVGSYARGRRIQEIP